MLLASKVLSPQFLIWLCPLIPLVLVRWRYLPVAAFIFVCIFTQYVYPYNYLDFEAFKKWPVSMMVMRNMLLMVVSLWYLLPLRYDKAEIERLENGGCATA